MISGFQRLPAVRAHRRFVAAIKETVRKARGSVPDPATVLPTFVGAEPLDFKVPAIWNRPLDILGVCVSWNSPTRHGLTSSDIRTAEIMCLLTRSYGRNL